MMKNVLGWRQYRGRVIPHNVMKDMTTGHRPYDTRLRMGQSVRLRVDDMDVTQFLSSIVVDVMQSHRSGVSYTLAFPASVDAALYIVVEGFSGTGMGLTKTESAEDSGIYTEAEYQAHMREQDETTPAVKAAKTLRLVTSVLDEIKADAGG